MDRQGRSSDGWDGGAGEGPIEEPDSNVDFFRVIYRVVRPDPGTIRMKFGH